MKIKDTEIENKLKKLGLVLPKNAAPVANYIPFVKVGNILYLAGTICILEGKITHAGKVGKEHTIESGYEAARVCALNTISNIKQALGSFEKIKQIVFVGGYVNGIDGFADSPSVINGASDLFVELFGESGKHARAAVAVAGLPKNSTVEIQCIVEVAE